MWRLPVDVRSRWELLYLIQPTSHPVLHHVPSTYIIPCLLHEMHEYKQFTHCTKFDCCIDLCRLYLLAKTPKEIETAESQLDSSQGWSIALFFTKMCLPFQHPHTYGRVLKKRKISQSKALAVFFQISKVPNCSQSVWLRQETAKATKQIQTMEVRLEINQSSFRTMKESLGMELERLESSIELLSGDNVKKSNLIEGALHNLIRLLVFDRASGYFDFKRRRFIVWCFRAPSRVPRLGRILANTQLCLAPITALLETVFFFKDKGFNFSSRAAEQGCYIVWSALHLKFWGVLVERGCSNNLVLCRTVSMQPKADGDRRCSEIKKN